MKERFFKVTVFPTELDLPNCPPELLETYTRSEYVELEEVADAMNIEQDEFDASSDEDKFEYFANYAYNMAWGELVKTENEYDFFWVEVDESEVYDEVLDL